MCQGRPRISAGQGNPAGRSPWHCTTALKPGTGYSVISLLLKRDRDSRVERRARVRPFASGSGIDLGDSGAVLYGFSPASCCCGLLLAHGTNAATGTGQANDCKIGGMLRSPRQTQSSTSVPDVGCHALPYSTSGLDGRCKSNTAVQGPVVVLGFASGAKPSMLSSSKTCFMVFKPMIVVSALPSVSWAHEASRGPKEHTGPCVLLSHYASGPKQ